jgi:hypothetical protein
LFILLFRLFFRSPFCSSFRVCCSALFFLSYNVFWYLTYIFLWKMCCYEMRKLCWHRTRRPLTALGVVMETTPLNGDASKFNLSPAMNGVNIDINENLLENSLTNSLFLHHTSTIGPVRCRVVRHENLFVYYFRFDEKKLSWQTKCQRFFSKRFHFQNTTIIFDMINDTWLGSGS